MDPEEPTTEPTPGPKIGSSSGWSVQEDPQGGFRWSADGPAGSRTGHAKTREDAEHAAQAAERELNEGEDPSRGGAAPISS
jgi:hypothetical protein